MSFMKTERKGSVAILQLHREVTQAIDLQLVHQLAESLAQLKSDAEVNSLVLCSSNAKFFSIGFHIPTLYSLRRKGFQIFYQAFNRFCIDLYTFPKPTIAAITGHAIAGGCILALCCDYRYIAQGRKLMGLNEVKLGVPVPYPGSCILRDLIGTRHSRELEDFGGFYEPEHALRIGLVDKILPVESVVPSSIETANVLGTMPHQAFQCIKKNRVETTRAHIEKHLVEKEDLFLECWFSEEARHKLKEAMEKF
jgi:enoyl-CoA hydratase/carnithine racemase